MSSQSSPLSEVLYPEIEPHTTGNLQVSPLHTIAWERCGNPQGQSVIVIHGGPGGGSQPSYRQYFNPEKFDIIQFDLHNEMVLQYRYFNLTGAQVITSVAFDPMETRVYWADNGFGMISSCYQDVTDIEVIISDAPPSKSISFKL